MYSIFDLKFMRFFMIKKILTTPVIFTIALTSSLAETSTLVDDAVVQNVTSQALTLGSRFFEDEALGFLPRGSTSEVSILGGTGSKPSSHMLFVAPLKETTSGVFFNQTQLGNYFVRGKSRTALNLGLGYRKISPDNKYFTGINTFLDLDSENNQRASLGLEYFTTPFSINANVYQRLSGKHNVVADYTETVVNGNDVSIIGQIPWVPWADVNYTAYHWDAISSSKDSKGYKLSTELRLTDYMMLEAGFDDNNINPTSRFAALMFTYPPHNRATLKDKAFATDAFEESDVRGDLLKKVKRNNRIVLESANVGVVMSRLD